MIENLATKLQNISSPHIATLLLASLPISELRGALPVAINIFKLPMRDAFLLSIVGNFIPIVPLLLFFDFITKAMKKYKITKKMIEWWLERTSKKSKIVEKYLAIGLTIFVAIPLPFTGAWSGCVAAKIFNIKFLQASIAIFIGIIIAGFIVLTINFGIIELLSILGM